MAKVKKETEEMNQTKTLEQEVEEIQKAEKTGPDTVIVACGIPMGVKLNANGKMIYLNGQPLSKIQGAHGEALPSGKFGLTEISREDWEALLKENTESPSFKNKVIFARESKDAVLEEAIDKSKEKLGFEQAEKTKGKTKPKTEKD